MRFSSTTTTTTIKTPTPTTVTKQYANAVLTGTGIMCSTLLELSVDDPSFHKKLMEAVTTFSTKLLGASYHG